MRRKQKTVQVDICNADHDIGPYISYQDPYNLFHILLSLKKAHGSFHRAINV